MLFRETLVDPLLSRYSVVMVCFREPLRYIEVNLTREHKIDEAHERSVYTDLLLGVLKKYVYVCLISQWYISDCLPRIRRKRPSLRLIVSSATLDATAFLNYFIAGNGPTEATIVSLEGRTYPVQVAYLLEPVTDYVQMASEVVWNIHLQV